MLQLLPAVAEASALRWTQTTATCLAGILLWLSKVDVNREAMIKCKTPQVLMHVAACTHELG